MAIKELEAEKNFKITFADKIENENQYAYFASIPKFETCKEFKEIFSNISNIKNYPEEKYQILLNNLRNKKTFNRQTDVVWICKNCGYIHIGSIAPDACPICRNPQSAFEIQQTDY